jgi:hypothetical protein
MHRTTAFRFPSVVFPSLALLLAAPAAAQWSSNPAANLPVADRTGEQALPKIAATRDGGCYIGWFDHANASYEVWLQRLDAAGQEQWPHNGILISNNPQSSSLVDWDLICDSDGDCVLTFTDTRAGGDLDVYAYRVDPAGALVWGSNGVALSNNADFEANPRVCETSIGDFAFVWSNSIARTLQLQRLSRAGAALYPGDGIAIPGETGATPGFVRVGAADNGSVIVDWVRQTAITGSNKHIHAQKFDVAGNALWNGGTRIAVFDQASLPIAHDPRLLPDGQGGAVLAWHFAVGSQFFARVQHVLANGAEAFAHNGVDLATNGDSKFDPAPCWLPATQSIVAFWNERNIAQSTWGISAQRIDAGGAQAWGSNGVTLLPITTTTLFAPVAVPFQDGALGFVLEQSLGGQNKKVRALRVDGQGGTSWSPVDACTFASDKLRLQAAMSPSGVAMLCWGDLRADGGNVIAQNVDVLGQLGNHLAAATPYGCVNPPSSLVAGGRPALGTAVTLGVDNPLATQSPGSLAFLVFGFAAAPGFPCGVPAPGFGMAPGGAGEILLDVGAGTATAFVGAWIGTQPVDFPFAVPLAPAFAGSVLFAQGAMLDVAPGATNPIGLTNGVQLAIGF